MQFTLMQPVKTLYFLVALCCYSVSIFAKNEKLPQHFRQQLSLLFIENKGQITDQRGAVRNDIDFKLQTPELTMFIGNGQLHYQWLRAEKQKEKVKTKEAIPGAGMPISPSPFMEQRPEYEMVATYRMDVTLVGANRHAQPVAEEPDAYYENYVTKNTGEKGISVHTYRKLTYKNIYPNIDWVLYVGAGEVLKYDFIVHPGGNTKDIQLRYDGATELKLHDGALTAVTPYGSITEQAPYTYMAENNQPVASAFVLEGNTLSFRVEHQSKGTLVIDPQLHWATYYGGTLQDYLYHVSGDDSGYVYTTGHTFSANNIATKGAYQDTLPVRFGSNYWTAFVAKFSGAGVRQWATYYHPGCDIWLYASKYNNGLFVTGRADTSTLVVLGTQGTQQPVHGGGFWDGLLMKFSSAGMPEWMTYVGGADFDYIFDIDIDGNGDLIIGGYSYSSNNIASTNAHQATKNATTWSGVLAKYSPLGVRRWGTYYSGNLYTYVAGVAVDKWNNIYICGPTEDTSGIVTKGTHKDSAHFTPQSTPGYYYEEGYIAKFDSSGKRIWGTYYGGSSYDGLWNLDCDDSGYVYATGWTNSNNGIATPGAYKTTKAAIYNAGIMVKFDSSGHRRWGTYLDSNYYNGYYHGGLTVHNNTIYLSGTTGNPSDIATQDAAQSTLKGQLDMYIMKFDTDGKKTWGTYFGGSGEEYNTGGYYGGHLHINTFKGSTNIYLTGHTINSDDLSTPDAHQLRRGGNYDGFLAKLTDDTLVSLNSEIPLYACVGDTITVGYRTTYSFRNGNVFTIQLSDDTGSFKNAVTLGTVTGDTTGELRCVIPLNTPRGDGYRIRVAASLRGDTSVESVNKIYINNIYPSDLAATSNSPVCLEDTIRLTASSAMQGVLYSWQGVNGFNAAVDKPVIANATATHNGDYIVTANLYGCKTKDTITVSTKLRPYSNIINYDAVALNTPCERDTLKLAATDANTGTTYSWAGPAGFNSSEQNPVIATVPFAYSGRFIVTTDLNGCTHKDTVNAVVKPLPQNFSAGVTGPVCSGTNVHLTATSSSGGVTWRWDGPNSFTTTVQNPTILAAQPLHNGDYVITATLNGCAIKDTVTAVVNVIPVKPTINTNTPVCEGDSLRFSGSTSTAGVTYVWSGPQSFAGTAGDTVFKAVTTSAAGPYTLTVSKDGCGNSEQAAVVVNPLPAPVIVTNNGPVCEGGSLQVATTSSTSGAIYDWVGPNNFSSTQTSNTRTAVSPADGGWYKVKVTLGMCAINDSMQAVVNATPVITGIGANQPLCVGQTLNLSVDNHNNGTFSWTGPGTYSSATRLSARTAMQYADTGWYRVSVVVNNCLSLPDSVYVRLNPLPFVSIMTPKDSICSGNTASFTALPNLHSGTPTYVWKVNGVPVGVGSNFSTPTLNNGDIISCDMTEYTKCSGQYVDASNDITMAVMPWLVPSVSIVASPSTPVKAGQQVQFSSTPVNGGSLPVYQWKRNGSNVQGATGATWSASTLNDNDEICVEMTSNYMCPQPAGAKSNCIKVRVLTGIGDEQLKGNLTLYPNPNNGRFILSGRFEKAVNGAVKAEVLNTLGQVIYRGELQLKSGELYAELQLPQVAGGTYLLRMSSAEVNHTMRFDVR